MYGITAQAHFDSAHFLKGHQGKCSNIHGHRWQIVAELEGDMLLAEGSSRGMLLDFGDFKPLLRGMADEFDHKLLVEEGSLSEGLAAMLEGEGFSFVTLPFRPTAEEFAAYFYQRLKEKGLPMSSVTVYETPDNCAVYRESQS